MKANRTKNRNFIALAIAAILAVSTCSTAFAEDRGTAEQREACTPDVLRLCYSSIFSVKAIISCMQEKKDQLSPPCRKVFSAIEMDRGPRLA
jgi:hypothetical protein